VESGLIEAFVRDGFVKLPSAVPGDVAGACAGLLWEAIGLDPDDPATWAEPVYWVGGMAHPPFVQAMNSLVVLEACEQLAGPGRWQPRGSMGSFPLRFPHDDEPDGLGWHVEGSYMPQGATSWWTNVRSRDRALLALYLFTDIDPDDGPTRIRVGSHLDVPPVLEPYGEDGAPGPAFAAELVAATGTVRSPTPRGAPATSTCVTPSWSTRPRPTTAGVHALWGSRRSCPTTPTGWTSQTRSARRSNSPSSRATVAQAPDLLTTNQRACDQKRPFVRRCLERPDDRRFPSQNSSKNLLRKLEVVRRF
jgi:hypothetical protein